MSDERRIRTTRVERYPDGSTIEVRFEDLPLPENDPHVRSREGSRRGGALSEIVTEFEAAADRPPTYPSGMPFLRNRAVWTTESPDGSRSTGARWRCSDPDAVLAEVVGISRSEGWSPEAAPPELAAALSPDAVVLRRRGGIRVLTKYEAGDVRVVELSEFDDFWLSS